MTQAERVAARKSREIEKAMKARAAAIEKAWTGIGSAITAGIAGITVGSVISKVITETRQAEQEQAQLAAVLKSTGEAAGWSQAQLNDMADAMEKTSTISAGDFNKAQAYLLEFTGVVGEQLPRALQAAADMATRRGMEITAAVELIGRAIDSPKDGLAALSKQGFKFSDDQKALAERLQETGRIAEAQAIILAALETSYSGAAQAARDTFGGAISALQNQLNSLMTGDEGSLVDAKKAVNDLTSILASPETKAAFDSITGWVFSLVAAIVTAVTNITSFINSGEKLALLAGTDTFSRAKNEAEKYSRELTNLTNKAIQMQSDLERDPENSSLANGLAKIRERIDEVRKKAQAATTVIKELANGVTPAEIAGPPVSARNKVVAPDASGAAAAAAARKKAAQESARLQKQQLEQAKNYLKQLQSQADKTQEITAYDKLMNDLKAGEVKLSDKIVGGQASQLDKALGLVTRLDMARELEEQRAAQIDQQNNRYALQNQLIAEGQGYLAQLDSYGMGDVAAQEMQRRVQIQQQAADELRKLEQDRQMAVLANPENAAKINATYADQAAALQEALQTRLGMYDDYIAQVRQKEGDWAAGAAAGLKTYLEDARDTYSQMRGMVENTFGSMEDAAVNFAKTGKLSFSSLIDGMISDLARMAAKQWISGLAGMATSSMAGTAIGAFFGFAGGGYTGPGGKYQPAGIVHAGEGVLNQGDIASIGGERGFYRLVDSIRNGSYANGGYVGASPAAVSKDWYEDGRQAGAGGVTLQNTIHIDARTDKAQIYTLVRQATAASQNELLEKMDRGLV